MKVLILTLVFMSTVFSNSTFAADSDSTGNKYFDEIMSTLDNQQFGMDEDGFLVLNGRPLRVDSKGFSRILFNTLDYCNQEGVYSNSLAVADDCKQNIVLGFNDWIDASKDQSISIAVWNMGARESYTSSLPSQSRVFFNHWVGVMRVAKLKEQTYQSAKPEIDRKSNINNQIYNIGQQIEAENKKVLFKDKNKISQLELKKAKLLKSLGCTSTGGRLICSSD
ncbi:hypothetical protein [Alkanindiges illinoisensis]|uniref:Uncharacterized protein n=1 Tax=Alkanindiges illinoisensis TaxID=197183 RepID=A0A4Y7XE81_9GAMM|nr:hypothetical protein [Alkanindiges illinoisensis]TEU30077.1 hypothetical protein E2B99_03280 [Alkanindiges illinoisensis]